ncbi:hypothetical protein ACLK1G_04805 [Pseudomonas sp. NR3]|uniref:hypothetical protein n=1 Tax=Pseudomonas sp. NR3 TaxID=3155978 RepID=UPI003B6740A5
MLNDLMFYSFFFSAAVFAVTYYLTQKSKGLAWIVTIVVALVVVGFVFPSPQQAHDLSNIANNFTLLISKVIYLLCWGGAAVILHKLLPD